MLVKQKEGRNRVEKECSTTYFYSNPQKYQPDCHLNHILRKRPNFAWFTHLQLKWSTRRALPGTTCSAEQHWYYTLGRHPSDTLKETTHEVFLNWISSPIQATTQTQSTVVPATRKGWADDKQPYRPLISFNTRAAPWKINIRKWLA